MTLPYAVYLSSYLRGEVEEALRWVRENCGKYHLDLDCIPDYQLEKTVWRVKFSFENEADATAFRLRW